MTRASSALARKDLIEFVRDRRFGVAALVVTLLAFAAVATSFVRVEGYERDRAAAEALDRETWLNQGPRNPHSAAHFSSWAMRPLTPLAVLDPGVTPYAGNAIWMEAHNQNPSRNRPSRDNASAFDLGQLCVGWVLQLLAPLLLFVVGAGLIARERERGTLRLMLASGLGASEVVARKLGVLGRIAAILILPITAAAMIAVAVLPGASAAEEGARILIWIAGYAIYLFVVVAIAIAVSAMSASTSRAMMLLIGLWLGAALLAPRVAASVAAVVAPTPPAEVFVANIARDRATQSSGHDGSEDAFIQSVLTRYGVASVADLPVSLAALELEESERQGNLIFDKRFGELAAVYARQREAARLAGVISPLISIQNISMALAGADMASQSAFQRQAETHRRRVITMLNNDMAEHGKGQDFDYLADPKLWSTIPAFVYQPPPLNFVLQSIWPDLLILLAWCGLAVMLLARARRHIMSAAL